MKFEGIFAYIVVFLLAITLNVPVMGQQDLKETYCPLCDMEVIPSLNQTLKGNQAVYACEMAGHLASIQNPAVQQDFLPGDCLLDIL